MHVPATRSDKFRIDTPGSGRSPHWTARGCATPPCRRVGTATEPETTRWWLDGRHGEKADEGWRRPDWPSPVPPVARSCPAFGSLLGALSFEHRGSSNARVPRHGGGGPHRPYLFDPGR